MLQIKIQKQLLNNYKSLSLYIYIFHRYVSVSLFFPFFFLSHPKLIYASIQSIRIHETEARIRTINHCVTVNGPLLFLPPVVVPFPRIPRIPPSLRANGLLRDVSKSFRFARDSTPLPPLSPLSRHADFPPIPREQSRKGGEGGAKKGRTTTLCPLPPFPLFFIAEAKRETNL